MYDPRRRDDRTEHANVFTPPPVRRPLTSREIRARERREASRHTGPTYVVPSRFYLYRVVYRVMTYLPIVASSAPLRRDDRQPFAVAETTSLSASKNAAYWYTHYAHRTTWLVREKRLLGLTIGRDRVGCVGFVFSVAEGLPREVPLSRLDYEQARHARPTQRL